MDVKDRYTIESLEKRIRFYRNLGAWIFLSGLIASACFLFGNPAFIFPNLSVYQRIGIRVLIYFSIAATGIAISSEHRRRIRVLKTHRDAIVMVALQGKSYPHPVREQTITEVQALYGILFFLSCLIACTRYPVPKMPDFLDSDMLRLAAIIGFFVLCRFSVVMESKNSLTSLNYQQDFTERIPDRVRIRSKRSWRPHPVRRYNGIPVKTKPGKGAPIS